MESLHISDRHPNGHVAQSSTLKRLNMRRFLEEVRSRGPSTRAELSRATGVAAPTSSTIISDLVSTGLIEEAEMRSEGKGRPGRLYRLASQRLYLVAATLGPKELSIAPASLNGTAGEVRRFQTPTMYEDLLETISNEVLRIKQERTGSCLGFAISIPGLMAESAGRVALSPNLHVIDGRPIRADLHEALGVDVLCVQEEHALCLAEGRMGHGRGLSDFAVLDITYGMGMGVVSGGRYISGRDGFAGEIGHMTADPVGKICGCGNRGCFETVATDLAFLDSMRVRLGAEVAFYELEFMVREKLIDIRPELYRTLDYLAIAVAGVVNMFNPEAVIVSSKLFSLGESVLEELVARSGERTLGPCRRAAIVPSKADRIDGVLAGLLDHVFASVGPVLV